MSKIHNDTPTFLQHTILFLFCTTVYGRQVAIKIVEEPTNYGLNIGGYQAQEDTNVLHMRITPSNFSGPAHLKQLSGHCFVKIFDSYKYELCPFANVTQYEQSLRWNPYSGVLGVWQEWEIANNTFVAMVMGEGDSCGSRYRTTKILLRCGEDQGIVAASEPSTCNYELVFTTPLVCHPHSMLVYPTLSPALRQEWDNIEGQLQAETITTQGYNKMLHHLFEKAGYVLPEKAKNQMSVAARIKEEMKEKAKEETFDSLYQCQGEYRKLKDEIEGLRTLLRVNGISDTLAETGNDQEDHGLPHGDYEQEHNPYQDYQWMHDD